MITQDWRPEFLFSLCRFFPAYLSFFGFMFSSIHVFLCIMIRWEVYVLEQADRMITYMRWAKMTVKKLLAPIGNQIQVWKAKWDVKVSYKSGDAEFGYFVILFLNFGSALIGSYFPMSRSSSWRNYILFSFICFSFFASSLFSSCFG